MTTLSIRNLWKTYGRNVVLENVSLEVKDGEFITVVGASGCGKSTFLRILLGEEPCSRGTISLNGVAIPSEPGPDRGIVFQRYSVFPHLTVIENVMLGLEIGRARLLGRLFGKARRQVRLQAQTMLDEVGLASASDKYAGELSGGMQQRVAIAQAVISQPKVLLLDEPFAALDPGISGDMHRLILRLWKTHKMNVFLITHDIKEGFELGTRLLVFDKRRHDPQSPEAFGAGITYDIPLNQNGQPLLRELEDKVAHTEAINRAAPLRPAAVRA